MIIHPERSFFRNFHLTSINRWYFFFNKYCIPVQKEAKRKRIEKHVLEDIFFSQARFRSSALWLWIIYYFSSITSFVNLERSLLSRGWRIQSWSFGWGETLLENGDGNENDLDGRLITEEGNYSWLGITFHHSDLVKWEWKCVWWRRCCKVSHPSDQVALSIEGVVQVDLAGSMDAWRM